MNQAEKELYLREYSILKSQGKPFFPYAVAKDSIMALIVVLMIVFLSLMFGAEIGPKADPTTTTSWNIAWGKNACPWRFTSSCSSS